MDCRCPVCRADLGRRKLSNAVVARMEIACSHCKRKIRFNVHRAEVIIVALNFATIVVLATLAYWFRSQGLVIVALGLFMVGSLALPVLERTYLRTWPRYATVAHSTDL